MVVWYICILHDFHASKVPLFKACCSYCSSILSKTFIRISDFDLIHVDEFIDELLREERSCDIILPRIQVNNKNECFETLDFDLN